MKRSKVHGDRGHENLVAIMAKLENMDRQMTKMDQSIRSIRVGCDNYNGPHLTKDYDLDSNRNRKEQLCYLSGDKYDEEWRKPKKEWMSYEEDKKPRKRNLGKQVEAFIQKKNHRPSPNLSLIRCLHAL